ncbi:DUF1161 domain-containing protein [Martelella alba]|uniref:DUF1161 domain-containing protein n=1 Tax=Martelella alba TaxID=2590451 RepID=A0ABY2SLK0_9HYPH|nr:DUF1161 domain-containing protein [Martelella alba]TKI05681.1 DUF1161 domain-containing protein [Martelella alba]
MKKIFMFGAVGALTLLPMTVLASCESVQADISRKIVENGLPASSFSLRIVPADQAEQSGGQVVGHCDNDTQKIIYMRTGGNGEDNTPSP